MYRLEENLHMAENLLSIATTIPVLGVIGGAGKVILGLVQTISALVVTLFAGIAAIFGSEKGKSYCFRASKHIFHGLGNILAGIVESIPFVGSISGTIRFISWNSAHPAGPGAGNYLAYGDLYKNESSFCKHWEEEEMPWFDTTPLPLICL